MATKTITLEIDAYERLKKAKKSEKESFSSVVRRAEFPAEPSTGAAILAFLQAPDSPPHPMDVLETLSAQQEADYANPSVTPSRWDGK